jgi:mRNA interferase MazF
VTQIAPWQVWQVRFDPQVGSEQAGTRPAVVIGSPLMCDLMRRLALVVPCTTRDRGLAWQPALMLAEPSFVMCEHVKSISRDRLVRRLPFPVPEDARRAIGQAVGALTAAP